MTDNGSNIVKAFKILQSEKSEVGELDSDLGTKDSQEEDEEEMDPEVESDDDDDTNFEEASTAAAHDMKQFEDHEDDHSNALAQLAGWTRCSCFTHSLQLVVKEFEKAPCFRKTINKTYKIIKKVNRSCKATEKLIALSNRKLVANCPTRWDSMFLMISRFVDLKEHVIRVLQELGWDGLTFSQWRQLQATLLLLQPFAHQTNVASSECTTSIAMVIPILKELELHLEEVKGTILYHYDYGFIHFFCISDGQTTSIKSSKCYCCCTKYA